MKKLLFVYVIVMLMLSITVVAHAGPRKQCQQIGKSKVKPYKFTKNQLKKYSACSGTVIHPRPKFVGSSYITNY